MKKATLIAFVLFIGLITSQAQVKVSPGLRGGVNFSTLTNVEDNSTKTDFYVGGLVNIKWEKLIVRVVPTSLRHFLVASKSVWALL